MSNPTSTSILPRKPDGSVNWRALVKPEHLYVKKDHEEVVSKKQGKPIADIDITQVEDRYLVIRKAGIIELARRRGYSSAVPTVAHVQRDYVVVSTLINWTEFEGTPAQTSGGVGEAHFDNTSRMGANYLAATAENRAFSRAVRQFLEIDIVSSDELGGGAAPEVEPAGTQASNPLTPQSVLQKTAEEVKAPFEAVQKAVLAKHLDKMKSDPTKWTKFDDVPPQDCMTIITLLREGKSKKAGS